MLAPTLLLATAITAVAAADSLTTSMWIQGGDDNPSTLTFHGSVLGASKDRTTVVLDLNDTFTDIQNYGMSGMNTITIGALTYAEIHYSSSVSIPGEKGDATVGVTCSKDTGKDALPVCTVSAGGNLAYLQYCAGWGNKAPVTYSEVYTDDTTTSTYIQTLSRDTDNDPGFCSDSKLPDSIAIQSSTVDATDFATYPLVLTAGVEKLSATTKAAASTTGPKPTGTAKEAEGSGAEASATAGGAAAGASANTGLAAPVVTPAAALAAVAMAAFVL